MRVVKLETFMAAIKRTETDVSDNATTDEIVEALDATRSFTIDLVPSVDSVFAQYFRESEDTPPIIELL